MQTAQYPGDVVEVSKAHSVSLSQHSLDIFKTHHELSRRSANPFDNESIEIMKKVQVAVP